MKSAGTAELAPDQDPLAPEPGARQLGKEGIGHGLKNFID